MSDPPDGDDRTDGRAHRTPHRVAGLCAVVLGTLCLVAASLGGVLGARVTASLDDDLQASTGIVRDSLDTVLDSIDTVRSVVATLQDNVEPIVSTTQAVADALDSSDELVEEVTVVLGSEVPSTLRSIADVLPVVETTAGTVEDALDALSELPFGPDYEPAQPLGDTIARLESDLDELADRLSDTAAEIDTTNRSLDEADLAPIADAADTIGEELDDVAALLDDYTAAVTDARDVATDALEQIDTDTDLAVAVVILAAVAFAAAQFLPIWLGMRLIAGETLVPAQPRSEATAPPAEA